MKKVTSNEKTRNALSGTDARQIERMIAGNRRELRNRGMTSHSCEVVQTYFRLKRQKRRVGLVDVSRCIGVSRQQVWQAFQRAKAVGLVFQVGRTFIFNIKFVLAMSKEAALARVALWKALKTKRKSGFVKQSMTLYQKDTLRKKSEVFEPQESRSEALKALKEMYVPVHLRRHA